MNRRAFLTTLSAALPLGLVTRRDVEAQDVEFLRALEAAQMERPARLTSSARIAPADEPGTPLTISGHVLTPSTGPAVAATVFAYHTDREGLYDRPGRGPHTWRLRGWARTDSGGRFEFRTIRPGAYPGRNIPAHVHFTVFTLRERYHGGELRFADDPLVPEHERSQSQREGEFGRVRPVSTTAGTQAVALTIGLDSSHRF